MPFRRKVFPRLSYICSSTFCFVTIVGVIVCALFPYIVATSCKQKQTNPSIVFFRFVFDFMANAAIVIFLSVIYVKQNKTIENAVE